MFTLNCHGRLVSFNKPVVMGILNATPDSFYAGSRSGTITQLISKAEKIISEGADIIDIGGQSTRPGSETIDDATELSRILPLVKEIRSQFPQMLISIDTFYSSVAEACLNEGAHMINDVSGGSRDKELWHTVARWGVAYVLMHSRGIPATMQQLAHYEDVVTEVFDELNLKLTLAKEAGIKDIIADPGFGFAKTIDHNFKLLNALNFFKKLGYPLLVGLSRKATVYKSLSITPEESLNGTTVLQTIALLQGADILRVHDVKEAREAIVLTEAYKNVL